MRAAELISPSLQPLNSNVTAGEALHIMALAGCSELAVVTDGMLQGYARSAALALHPVDSVFNEVIFFAANPLQARADQHLYEIVPLFASLNSSVLAVSDDDQRYLGMIDLKHLNEVISQTMTYKGVGSILELKLLPFDFTPAELNRLVEENKVKVVGMVVNELEDGKLQVFLKLNTTLVKAVVATLERFGYEVLNIYQQEDSMRGDDDHYRSFLKFLDL